MQLSARVAVVLSFLFAAFAVVVGPRVAHAQVVDVTTTHSIFHEAPSRSNMTVYTPGADLQVSPWRWLDVRAGWEADVVSGASVAVKAGSAYGATHAGADVITAASVHDFRNLGRGGFTLKKDNVTLTAGYAYGTEHDYRSNSLNVTARTDVFEHNTQFEIAYGRNWDQVCDRIQASTDPPPRYRALEDSTGCFTKSSDIRTARDLAIDSFQASWTQAWTPVFVSQLIYGGEIIHGFQSNPYRSIIVGEGLKSQEHEPDNRARQSVALRANWFLRPIKSALRATVRGYGDTWDVKSVAAELELERSILADGFRVMLRGRFYKQSGAVFWSDDYTGGERPLGPKGQYWTGDKELSPFWSLMGGVRAMYTAVPKTGRILGIMTQLKFGGEFDAITFHYDEYTLAGLPLQGALAIVGTLTLTALF